MPIFEIIMIAIALSMDAFAVSVAAGIQQRSNKLRVALTMALFFGAFQALMPMIGWWGGHYFQSFIANYAHWIAMGLLSLIGIKMIKESFSKKTNEMTTEYSLSYIFLLAIATSIDALAVGTSFAMLAISIWLPVLLIGIVTFILSLLGVMLGQHLGSKVENVAEFVGGLILIIIGLKILAEHLLA